LRYVKKWSDTLFEILAALENAGPGEREARIIPYHCADVLNDQSTNVVGMTFSELVSIHLPRELPSNTALEIPRCAKRTEISQIVLAHVRRRMTRITMTVDTKAMTRHLAPLAASVSLAFHPV
jgi:hypothetical protein